MDYIEKLKKKITNPRQISTLTEDMIWQQHEPLIWQADHFEGKPFFYNVYCYKNYYSYSLLALILLKGRLNLNQYAVDKTNEEDFANHKENYTIDLEIEKIGAPYASCFDIVDPTKYCALIAEALIKDVSLIEAKNPGKINIIMCGGRDSMNLLLLPWKNPVLAISAEPNFTLVEEFVRGNNLEIPVRKLKDSYDEDALKTEVVEACCRADLSHWRWGGRFEKHWSRIST